MEKEKTNVTCILCGTQNGLSMYAHRSDGDTIVGWVFCCNECAEKVAGKIITVRDFEGQDAEIARLKDEIEDCRKAIQGYYDNKAAMEDEIERKDAALEHIIEYWNGGSESAVDAIEEAISTAEEALTKPEEVEG